MTWINAGWCKFDSLLEEVAGRRAMSVAMGCLSRVVVVFACLAAFSAMAHSNADLLRYHASNTDAVPQSGITAEPVAARHIDEREYGFRLNIPDDWTADIDAQNRPVMSWRLHQNDWLSGQIPDGLLSLSVSVLEPDAGQDTAKLFRGFVDKFGNKFLKNAKVLSFEPFHFGHYSGFDANVSGQIKLPSSKLVRVRARLFIYLLQDREIIVSAVAPLGHAGLLDDLGQPGAIIEASASPGNSGADKNPEQTSGQEVSSETGAQTARVQQQPPQPIPAIAIHPVSLLPGSLSRFRSVSWGGSKLEEFGSLGEEGLTISMPADARTGGVGIASSGSLVNLGDLEAGAATTLRFDFDPAQSNNALLVLCPGTSVPCLSDPSLVIVLQPEENGTALSLVADSIPLARTVLSGGMPSQLSIRIDKDGIYVFPSNGSGLLVDRPRGLVAFAGLELLAAAVPLPSPSQLKLTAITAQTSRGNYALLDLPAPDPRAVIFPSRDPKAWTEFGASGGDFPTMAKFADGRLEVSVLPGNQWGYTGLVSAAAVFKIPETDGEQSPRRLHGKVDPAIPTMAFAVSLLPHASSNVWLDSVAFATFSRNDDQTHRLRLTACRSATSVVEMEVDASWSGDFDLEVSPQRLWFAAGRQRVSLHMNCGLPDMQGHVAIFAAAPREHDPAALSLINLAIDRLPLPEDDRANDSSDADDGEFDAAVWMGAMAADLAEASDAK